MRLSDEMDNHGRQHGRDRCIDVQLALFSPLEIRKPTYGPLGGSGNWPFLVAGRRLWNNLLFFALWVSLIRPLFSVTSSFLDGLYSTLWGDGLCAGVPDLLQRPPWNYSLMCAGYLLSLLPTTLLLIGAVTASVELFRDLRSDLFVLVGFPAAVAAALVFFDLKVPSYGS